MSAPWGGGWRIATGRGLGRRLRRIPPVLALVALGAAVALDVIGPWVATAAIGVCLLASGILALHKARRVREGGGAPASNPSGTAPPTLRVGNARFAVPDGFRRSADGVKVAIRAVRRFRGELSRHRRKLLAAAACAIGYSAARIAEPWPLKFVFDNVFIGRPLDTPLPWLNRVLDGKPMGILVTATAALLALAVLRSVLYYYQRILTAVVGQDVVLKVRQQAFAHLQRLSLSFHARSSTGDLLTRLTADTIALRELLVTTLLAVLSQAGLVIGLMLAMFLLEWRLALVALVVMPVLFLLLTVYAGRIRAVTRKQRRREGELAGRLQEALAGIHVVQMFAREDEEDARLRTMNRKSLKEGLKVVRLEARLNRAVELSIAAATAATVWLGATQVIAGRLTPGELIVFVAYMQAFYRPLRRVSRTTQGAAKASTSYERLTALLDEHPEVRGGTVEAPAFRGEIRLERVDFAYTPETPVLRGINLEIEPGQTVALVGPTGAGKSTLLSLIPRLYDPSAGVVRIDGYDVRQFTLKSLRDQMSVVPQDGMLFAGTFEENIAYGKADAQREEIEQAARRALIHDFIASAPEGYASLVGERGVTLSGGQRQRLAIARALVKDAPIVLLDEPVTGLDAESERLVMAALEQLLTGRTAVIIAHRLATIQRADAIAVVDAGRIVERGSHEQLMLLGGRYRELYETQIAVAATDPTPVLQGLATGPR